MHGIEYLSITTFILTLFIDREYYVLRFLVNLLLFVAAIYFAEYLLSIPATDSVELWHSIFGYVTWSIERLTFWLTPPISILLILYNIWWIGSNLLRRPRSKLSNPLQEEVDRLKRKIAHHESVSRTLCLEIAQLQAQKVPVVNLDAKTLRDITILCHPDKHGGSQKAVQVTQLLNSLRSK